MVMERPLSPQSVGREFVRQYYTLLNEAPAHLHRFYNNSSSFIHGGLDSPNRESVAVVGQKQIHQRIQQLNFRDCHAKISQVDSQATLGNGVVVQVTGELSNAGQPMRRFTQTFVLAAQSPKKYYVHNDIFRYQDMIITDEDMEGDLSRSEAGEDQENDVEQNDIHTVQSGQQQTGGYYGNQVVNGTSEVEPPQDDPSGPLCEPPGQPLAQPQPTQYQEDYDTIPQQPPQVQPLAAPVQEMVAPLQQQTQGGSYMVVEMQNNQPEDTEYHHTSPPVQPTIPPQIVQPHIMPSEPKTYATLVKSGTQIGGPVYYNTSPTNHTQQHLHHHSSEDMSPPPQNKSENKGFDMRPNHNTPKPQRSEPIRNNYNSTPRHQSSDEHNGNSFGGDGDRRRLQYSDNHQVFVGNIPRNVTESGLRDVFAQFGSIVGLKIFPKNTSKSAGQLKVPYYGFVTFEDISSVQAVLNTSKPIMFPDENGVKLNVEEKKARRGDGGGGGGGGGGRIGGRGGPGGPMMRGGTGGGPGGLGGGTPPRGGGGRGGGGVRFNTPVPTRR